MSSAPVKKDPVAVEAEVREKIHLEILKRTGAYHANDHVLLPSGQHTSEYIEKTLVTTEPSFTEGLGGVIAKHFAPWPVDAVLSSGGPDIDALLRFRSPTSRNYRRIVRSGTIEIARLQAAWAIPPLFGTSFAPHHGARVR